MSGTNDTKPTQTAERDAGVGLDIEQQLRNGVSSAETATVDAPRTRPLNAREQARVDIQARRQEQLAHELDTADLIIDTSTPRDEERELSAQERNDVISRVNLQETARANDLLRRSTVAQPAKPAQQPVQARPVQTASEVRKPVTIAGQTLNLTQAEIDALVTLGAQQVDAQRRQATQPQAQPTPTAPVPQPVTTTAATAATQPWTPPTVNAASAKAILKDLAYGNDDNAVFAIQNIIATAVMIALRESDRLVRAPGGLVDYVINEATKQAIAQSAQQATLKTDLETIAAEYPECFKSTLRGNMASNALQAVYNRNKLTGTQMSELDCYREACQITYAELGLDQPVSANAILQQPTAVQGAQTNQQRTTRTAGIAASAQVPTVTVSSNRVERKRAASTMPHSAGRANGVEQTAQQAKTSSEIVAEMRARRGQAPLN